MAVVDATTSKGVLSRFAEAGLVRGYPTLLLFRRAAALHARTFAQRLTREATGTARCSSTREAATWSCSQPLFARRVRRRLGDTQIAVLTPRLAAQKYKESTGHAVPPPPSAVKRAVVYVSDIAERTGLAIVPIVKRVVQSRVYRGLKQMPRRNDPRGLTLLVRAICIGACCAAVLSSASVLTCSGRAGLGLQVPACGGAFELLSAAQTVALTCLTSPFEGCSGWRRRARAGHAARAVQAHQHQRRAGAGAHGC